MHSLPDVTRESAIPTKPSLTFIATQNVMYLSLANWSRSCVFEVNWRCNGNCSPSLLGEYSGLGRANRKERLVDLASHQVQPLLQPVDKLVQTMSNNLLGASVGQFCAELSEQLFGMVAEASENRTRYRVQRLVGIRQAVQNSPGEFPVEHQKLDDARRLDSPVALTIHLE